MHISVYLVKLHRGRADAGWASALFRRAQKGGRKKGDSSFHSFEMCSFSDFEFHDVNKHILLLILLV